MALDGFMKFRVSAEERRRLDALSEVTGESRSAVLRTLIRTAELTQRPVVTAGPLRSEENEQVAA